MNRVSDAGPERTALGGRAAPLDRTSGSTVTWAFGPVAIACASTDSRAALWLAEFLEPWFEPSRRTPDWRVEIHSSRAAYVSMRDGWPSGLERRGCFSLDERTSSLPACGVDGGVRFANIERSCFFTVRPGEVAIVADPATSRWRFAAMRIIREIGTTRLRREALDVHAAAVERGGRAVLICGPKFSGKTTLAVHLLRSGGCRLIGNDRVFVRRGAPGSAGPPSTDVRGVPTAVKIRPATVRQFPELGRNLPRVATPYLHTCDELASGDRQDVPPDETGLSLTPFQVARQLGVDTCGGAPLGAVLFPEIRDDQDGVTVERLAPEIVASRIRAGLYGVRSATRVPTVFEEMDAGKDAPTADVVDAMAAETSGFRVILGRRAYEQPGSAALILSTVRGR